LQAAGQGKNAPEPGHRFCPNRRTDVCHNHAAAMAYREHWPHPALRPFVDRFWTESGPRGPGPRLILPDGCIDLIVNLTRGRAVVVGTMTRALQIPRGATAEVVAVRFRPAGAAPFLRVPAHEVTDVHIDCADLGLATLIPPQLQDAGGVTADQMLAALQRTLLDRLTSAPDLRGPDPLIDHAARLLLSAEAPSIEALARRMGYSRQHLRRTFRAQIGVGPKHFDKVARLQRATALLQGAPRNSLADVAVSVGYFDQAHMNGDFRDLVGATPQAVRRAAGSIFPIRSLLGGA
jgi:AraC-like DNA-binding protein